MESNQEYLETFLTDVVPSYPLVFLTPRALNFDGIDLLRALDKKSYRRVKDDSIVRGLSLMEREQAVLRLPDSVVAPSVAEDYDLRFRSTYPMIRRFRQNGLSKFSGKYYGDKRHIEKTSAIQKLMLASHEVASLAARSVWSLRSAFEKRLYDILTDLDSELTEQHLREQGLPGMNIGYDGHTETLALALAQSFQGLDSSLILTSSAREGNLLEHLLSQDTDGNFRMALSAHPVTIVRLGNRQIYSYRRFSEVTEDGLLETLEHK